MMVAPLEAPFAMHRCGHHASDRVSDLVQLTRRCAGTVDAGIRDHCVSGSRPIDRAVDLPSTPHTTPRVLEGLNRALERVIRKFITITAG